jgi:LysM repeat protein
MRTDVKIGIAVGLLMAVVAVLWFAFNHNKDAAPAAPAPQAGLPHRTLPAVTPSSSPSHSDDSAGSGTPYHTALGSSAGGAGDLHPTTMPAGGLRISPGSPATPGSPVAGGTSSSPDVYVVQSGDTAWKIVDHAYNNTSKKYMDAVKAANPGVDLSHLSVKQKLNLPKIASVPPTTTMPVARSTTGTRSTPVASGSTTPSRTVPTRSSTPSGARPIFD